MTTFHNTRAALVEFDAGAPARAAAWDRIGQASSDADVWAADGADKAALCKVQEAFYEDTNHINSRDNCMRCDLQFMRRMAALSGPHTTSQESHHG